MNTTNENNNFENETIETTSNELETQDTYGSETTTETNVINSPNKNYKVRANYYNYVFNDSDNNDPNNHRRLDNAPIDVVVDPEETGKYINVTSGDMSAWVPCVSIEYSGNLYDDNGNTTGDINLDESFDCTFKAEVPFLNNGGYNGCINFTWTNKSLGQNSIPENCIASDYDVAYNEANPENSYGLFDSVLNSTDMNGFSVTFFPSNVYEHDGGYYTTQLSRYVLSYKTVSLEGDCTENLVKHKAGNLPQNVNIFDFGGDNAVNTKIYVEHSSDKYNFYLNGILFASVQDIFVDMEKWGNNDGYFTASILTIPYVAANLQIIDIGSYSLNLTQTEKTNIGNLGVNILNYYVDNEGIEEKDYTEAFRTALTNHRRVYVPGGTYRITGELEIGDNCELELAQDAVLDFQPVYYKKTIDAQTGEITVNRDEPAIFEELEDDPSDFRCITLNMLSSLIGNHATIRVPYNFKGSVIYASTRSHPNSNSINSVTPFDRWDPQWKPARYLKDINIVKPIEQNSAGNVSTGLVGRHSSLNGETNGTAVFIEGHRNTLNTGSTYIWGLDYSGLRIGGAFKYGIYGTNN